MLYPTKSVLKGYYLMKSGLKNCYSLLLYLFFCENLRF